MNTETYFRIFTFLAIVFLGPCFIVYKHLSLGISGIGVLFKMFGRKEKKSLVADREYIDYKDVDLLQRLVAGNGKMVSRRQIGCNSKMQHMSCPVKSPDRDQYNEIQEL